jgi:hypothetical protein
MTQSQGDGSKGKPKKDDVKLTVVVNGTSVNIKADPDDLIGTIVEPALKKAGVADSPDVSRWILKDKDGNVLDKASTIESFGFTDKALIFLSLDAGVAG